MKSSIIRNRDRAKQLLAFDGMQYGKCRPTDVDVSIDFQGKTFVFVELKGAGAPLTVGQRIHLEGLVDAIVAGGRAAVAIVAHHDTPDPSQDVHVAEARVTNTYDGQQWVKEAYMEAVSTVDVVIRDIHKLHEERKAG